MRPPAESLLSQQRVPSWFSGLKRPAEAPLPAHPAQRQRPDDQGFPSGVPDPLQSLPVRTSQENRTISAALRHFGLSWEALDVAQLGTIREAARSVSGMEAGVFPEQLHAAILGALRQRREQPVIIDTERFANPAASGRSRSGGGAIYGGITINGPHHGHGGELLYYLEQGQPGASVQHASNAMVGAPVLALSDFTQHEIDKLARGPEIEPDLFNDAVAQTRSLMRQKGVPLSTFQDVLQEKLGMATHRYQHIPDGAPGLNRRQAALLDGIDTDRGFLQVAIGSEQGFTSHCVAFRKEGQVWTLLDSNLPKPVPDFPPSRYLQMPGVFNFTALWPRQGVSASGIAALPLNRGADALLPDPASLAARLGLEDVSKLHDVIPEWDAQRGVLLLWGAEEKLGSSTRLQELHKPPIELAGPESAALYKALMDYQMQRQVGKQAMPVGPTPPIPPSPAAPPLHPLQRQWREQEAKSQQVQPQQAVGPETLAHYYSAEVLGPAMSAWSKALKEAEPLSPDDRKVFLAEARRQWLDSVTAKDSTPWETWPVLEVTEWGAGWWGMSGHDKPIPYDPGSESGKIAAWKVAVVLYEGALDTDKPDRFGEGWAPPLKVKGITYEPSRRRMPQCWQLSNSAEGREQNPRVYFGRNEDDLTKDQAWRKAIEILADLKGPRTARPIPRADLSTTMQRAMLVWEKDLAAINNLDESSDEKAKQLADARRKWLKSVTEGDTEPWKKWKVQRVYFRGGRHCWVVDLTHKEKRHERSFRVQRDLSDQVEQWIEAMIQAQAFRDTFDSKQQLTLWGSWVPPVTLHHLDLDTNEPRWIATLDSGRKEPVSFQDRNNREKEEAWHGAFRTLTAGNVQTALAPQAGSSRQADPDND